MRTIHLLAGVALAATPLASHAQFVQVSPFGSSGGTLSGSPCPDATAPCVAAGKYALASAFALHGTPSFDYATAAAADLEQGTLRSRSMMSYGASSGYPSGIISSRARFAESLTFFGSGTATFAGLIEGMFGYNGFSAGGGANVYAYLQMAVNSNFTHLQLNYNASGLGAGTHVTTLSASDPLTTIDPSDAQFLLTMAQTLTFGAGDCDLGCSVLIEGELYTNISSIHGASAEADFGNTAQFGLTTTGDLRLADGTVFLSEAPATAVPEPASVILVATGLIGLAFLARRKGA